jgi:plasmid stabilization system protein ParE
MQYNLDVSPEAELDIQNAIDYYFAINIDLAYRFRDELHDSYEKITTNPQFYKCLSKKKEKNFRRVQLKSFPYIVIYWTSDNKIIVTSVFSTHRKPVYGQL